MKCMSFLTAILIYTHNYDSYFLYAKLHQVKNSFLAYFVSRTILAVIDHMQKHFSPTTLEIADFSM